MSEAPTPTPNPEPALAPSEQLYGQQSDTAPVEPEVKPEVKDEVVETEGEKKDAETSSAPAIEVKLPEGVEIDQVTLDSFTALAAEAGVTSEAAQKFLDLHLAQLENAATLFADAQTKAFEDTIESWKTALTNDPELGGDKQAAVQSVLGKALDTYGSKEAREAFDATGAGWNPHIVKTIYNMAKALSEGTLVEGSRPTVTRKRGAEALYDNPQ